MRMSKGLTAKQKLFCEQYLIDCNGTRAAVSAGYSPKTARFQSSRMLTNVDVQQYLNGLRSQQQERLEINADAVLKELAIVGFSKITDVLEFDGSGVRLRKDLSPESVAAIQTVRAGKTESGEQLQVRMHNKIQALKELGLHFGLFDDFNRAIATLKQYGTIEATQDGHIFRTGV